MTSKHLHEALQNLHREFVALRAEESRQPLDEKSQELLETVLKDIQGTIEARLPHDPAVVDKLESAALSFELRHPTLATLGAELVDLLRKAGV